MIKEKEKVSFYKETNFKDTEIGKIPEDWEVVRLKDVLDNIGNGLNAKQNKDKIGYPVTRIETISDGKINLTRLGYVEEINQEDINKYRLKIGDVLFSHINSDEHIGKVAIYEGKPKILLHGINLLLLRPNKNKLKPHYFLYTLKYVKQKNIFKNIAKRAVNQSSINQVQLKNLKLLLPPLKEQKAIAKVLKDFDDLLEVIDKQVEKLEKIKKGLMNVYFTKGIFKHEEFKDTEIGKIPADWKVVKVKDIFYVKTGTTPSTKIKEYWENGTENWFTPEDFNKGKTGVFLKSSKRKITLKAIEEKNLNVLSRGSILISTRAPVGYVALLEEEGCFNQGCKGLEAKININSLFYVYYLSYIKRKLEELSGGSTFKELSKSVLENLKLPLPPLEEQKAIAERLKNIDDLIETKQKEKKHLERAKKKVMDLLLTGKVRVREEA